jgi:hypothetical protein
VLRRSLAGGGTAADSTGAPQFIETLARQGYRFVPPVETIAPSPAESDRARAARFPRTFVIVGLAITLLVGMAVWNPGGWRANLTGQSAPAPIHSLAVLPLENLSGDPDQDYMADTMTDQLTTDRAPVTLSPRSALG